MVPLNFTLSEDELKERGCWGLQMVESHPALSHCLNHVSVWLSSTSHSYLSHVWREIYRTLITVLFWRSHLKRVKFSKYDACLWASHSNQLYCPFELYSNFQLGYPFGYIADYILHEILSSQIFWINLVKKIYQSKSKGRLQKSEPIISISDRFMSEELVIRILKTKESKKQKEQVEIGRGSGEHL